MREPAHTHSACGMVLADHCSTAIKSERAIMSKHTDSKNETPEVGEGNHEADRRYRDATERFIAEGKVEPAAAEAVRAVNDKDERRVLKQAEEAGRAPAKRGKSASKAD
jgi:hypothetical protein